MTTTTMDAHGHQIPAPQQPDTGSRLRDLATSMIFLFGVGTLFTAVISVGLLVFVGE